MFRYLGWLPNLLLDQLLYYAASNMEEINLKERQGQNIDFFYQVLEMHLVRKRFLNHGLNNYSRVS